MTVSANAVGENHDSRSSANSSPTTAPSRTTPPARATGTASAPGTRARRTITRSGRVSAIPHVHHVDRDADPNEHPDRQEDPPVEPQEAVDQETDTAPDEDAREKRPEYRPGLTGTLPGAASWGRRGHGRPKYRRAPHRASKRISAGRCPYLAQSEPCL